MKVLSHNMYYTILKVYLYLYNYYLFLLLSINHHFNL